MWLAQQLRAVTDAAEAACRWLTGGDGQSTYVLSRWVFLRALGIIYLIAFLSLWVQVRGLIGSHGILPAQDYLAALRGYLGASRFRLAPTLFWVNASDAALVTACAAGTVSALLLAIDVVPLAALAVLWTLYLSFVVVGQDFFSFQWDVLLLETGLLAILFAPGNVLPGRTRTAVSSVALVLLWWLLFRLTFQSGVVKLTSGDPTWRHLTALDYHFWTQPLPTWTAWFMALLPEWMKRGMVVATLVLEIGFPLLIFGTRGMRVAAFSGVLLMQVMILTTGNYNFFNLLTIALALLLLDDRFWASLLPARVVAFAGGGAAPRPMAAALVVLVLGAGLFYATLVQFWFNVIPGATLPRALTRPVARLDPLRSANSYGLFRVMTTDREEIIVQGSNDGVTWQDYEFRYKPGDLTRRPGFVEPHQPRLDWQMWFAALSSYEGTPWFRPFLARLLDGSPDVLGLLGRNPFPNHPPRYVRALVYQYRFATPPERRATGVWWTRALVGPYSPVLSLTP